MRKSKKMKGDEKTKKTEKADNDIKLKDVAIYILDIKLKNFLAIIILLISISFSLIYNYNTNSSRTIVPEINKVPVCKQQPNNKRTYKIFPNDQNESHLKHVHAVLQRIGFRRTDLNSTNWNLLWGHAYPFRVLYPELRNLKPDQKVNHFPGNGYITLKVNLATTKSKYIPPAFKLPEQKQELLDYSNEYPEKSFVYKDNSHRNIKVMKIQDIDLNSTGNFMQEFVDKPFLVDGYKFDIGVYTIITSIDPLRVYIYNGDVLFRYCMNEYYPFDPNDLDKYVIGDDYRPTWKVPSLEYYYNTLNFSMRDSFNAYLRSKNLDPEPMWRDVEDAIVKVILQKEDDIISTFGRYSSTSNFFELMRFDLILDENLKVYLLEANMSPNLSSAHYPPNQKLYEQVLHNLFSLVGLTIREEETTPSWERSLAVYPEECVSEECEQCSSTVCLLCAPCRTNEITEKLKKAHEEYVNRRECKRIYPPSMMNLIEKDKKIPENIDELLEEYSPENRLQYRWFLGKCVLNEEWC